MTAPPRAIARGALRERRIAHELRVLKYFLMVAREENVTRAAELLHITQPTLSRQLAQLEEEFNAKLFIAAAAV